MGSIKNGQLFEYSERKTSNRKPTEKPFFVSQSLPGSSFIVCSFDVLPIHSNSKVILLTSAYKIIIYISTPRCEPGCPARLHNFFCASSLSSVRVVPRYRMVLTHFNCVEDAQSAPRHQVCQLCLHTRFIDLFCLSLMAVV